MISFDFKTYSDKFIQQEDLKKLISKKESIFQSLENNPMNGWTRLISSDTLYQIEKISQRIKNNSSCLVVIGIGGSFLGSYAVKEMLTPYFNDSTFKVIYAGTSLSSKYMEELLSYLKNIDFSLNVISKSGTTRETTITYNLLKNLMQEKYSLEELKQRIIITTDEEKGTLREEANKVGYASFTIPNDIGGRYSFLTPAHLLPLSLNYDILKFVDGYNKGQELKEAAYEYAMRRQLLYQANKYVENFCVYEPNMASFLEWLKQLFAETEGKDNKGILPISTIHTRDLHSLGQFIQEGHKIMFETFLKVRNSTFVAYDNNNLHQINNIVLDSVIKAHYSGNVPCLLIEIDEINEETIGELIYFFQLAAAFSGYLFNVDPFNQPGVEVYKNEVRQNLDRM